MDEPSGTTWVLVSVEPGSKRVIPMGSKSHGENDLVTIPDSDISGHIEDLENIGFSTSKIHKLFIPKLNKDNECFVNPIFHFFLV